MNLPPDGEFCIFSYVDVFEVMGVQLMPPREIVEGRNGSAMWLSKLFRHSGKETLGMETIDIALAIKSMVCLQTQEPGMAGNTLNEWVMKHFARIISQRTEILVFTLQVP